MGHRKDNKTQDAIVSINKILGSPQPTKSLQELTDCMNIERVKVPRADDEAKWDADRVKKVCRREGISLPFDIPRKPRGRRSKDEGEPEPDSRYEHHEQYEGEPEASPPDEQRYEQSQDSHQDERPLSHDEHCEDYDRSQQYEQCESIEESGLEGQAEESPLSHRSYHWEQDPPVTEDRMREIAREVCREMLNSMNVPTTPDLGEDTPPLPENITGRKQNREYERVTITVDKVLWRKFKAERARLNVSTGRLLDILLWRSLGKPRLSYEEPE